jgi:hypothetical protein
MRRSLAKGKRKEVVFDVPMLRISHDVCKEKSEESF